LVVFDAFLMHFEGIWRFWRGFEGFACMCVAGDDGCCKGNDSRLRIALATMRGLSGRGEEAGIGLVELAVCAGGTIAPGVCAEFGRPRTETETARLPGCVGGVSDLG